MDDFQEKQKQNQKVYEAAKRIIESWPKRKRDLAEELIKNFLEEEKSEKRSLFG